MKTPSKMRTDKIIKEKLNSSLNKWFLSDKKTRKRNQNHISKHYETSKFRISYLQARLKHMFQRPPNESTLLYLFSVNLGLTSMSSRFFKQKYKESKSKIWLLILKQRSSMCKMNSILHDLPKLNIQMKWSNQLQSHWLQYRST